MPVLAGANEVADGTSKLDPLGLSFRAMRPSDLDLMHRWLNTPHVRRWWYDEGTSRREIETKYLPLIEGRDTAKPFVILYGDRPIGYIQSYRISTEDDEEYAKLVNVEDSAGVDLFIGEAEYLYRGLGQHVVLGFVSEHIFSDPGIEVCVIGPETKNVAAVRAYEKAGFRFFKTIQVSGEPEPEYLMKLAKEEFESDDVD